MAKNALDDKFKEIAGQIKDAVVDFTTLEVTTLTGDVNQIIKTDSSKKTKIDVSNILGKLKGSAKGNVSLVAFTQINFDQDTINFIKSDLGEDEIQLFKIHQEAVASAHNGRNGFLSFLQKALV
ncbi:MAG: hypothetical protein AAF985_21375 [Bacteroidota bacterium]